MGPGGLEVRRAQGELARVLRVQAPGPRPRGKPAGAETGSIWLSPGLSPCVRHHHLLGHLVGSLGGKLSRQLGGSLVEIGPLGRRHGSQLSFCS